MADGRDLTPEQRRALVLQLCAEIMARPLSFKLDVRGGVITPLIPKVIPVDFARKRKPRRLPLSSQVIEFPHIPILPPYKG